jgi:hypothetical protein
VPLLVLELWGRMEEGKGEPEWRREAHKGQARRLCGIKRRKTEEEREGTLLRKE